MAIWYEDLPVTPLTQAPALVPFNYTYWEGWPNAENPWMMPVNWWATMNLLLTGYPSPSTGEWVREFSRLANKRQDVDRRYLSG